MKIKEIAMRFEIESCDFSIRVSLKFHGVAELVPKISDYSLLHWDRFIGVCLVLVGLASFAGLLEKLPHPVAVLLLGVSVNAFAMMRRSIQFIGNVRRIRLAALSG